MAVFVTNTHLEASLQLQRREVNRAVNEQADLIHGLHAQIDELRRALNSQTAQLSDASKCARAVQANVFWRLWPCVALLVSVSIAQSPYCRALLPSRVSHLYGDVVIHDGALALRRPGLDWALRPRGDTLTVVAQSVEHGTKETLQIHLREDQAVVSAPAVLEGPTFTDLERRLTKNEQMLQELTLVVKLTKSDLNSLSDHSAEQSKNFVVMKGDVKELRNCLEGVETAQETQRKRLGELDTLQDNHRKRLGELDTLQVDHGSKFNDMKETMELHNSLFIDVGNKLKKLGSPWTITCTLKGWVGMNTGDCSL